MELAATGTTPNAEEVSLWLLGDDPVDHARQIIAIRERLLTSLAALDFPLNKAYAMARAQGRLDEVEGLLAHPRSEIVARTRRYNSETGNHLRWGEK